MVNEQEQPGYKIRHIKSGVRLLEWCCSSVEFIEILWENNLVVHRILLDLYEQEYMALSIKLMILKALDAYLLNKQAMEYFLGGKFHANSNENGFHPTTECYPNGYTYLINLLSRNPSVRLKFALNSILKKVNIFEALAKLYDCIEKSFMPQRYCGNIAVEVHFIEKYVIEMKLFAIEDFPSLFFFRTLEHILGACCAGCFVLSQPKRFLPVPAQFEVNRTESRNVLIDLFRMHNLLHCLTALLTSSSTMNLPFIKSSVYEILSHLLQSPEGLQYLSTNCNTVNLLLKCLLRNEDEIQFQMKNASHMIGLEVILNIAISISTR